MKQTTRNQVERWLRKRGYTRVKVLAVQGDARQPKYQLRVELEMKKDGQRMVASGHGLYPDRAARKVMHRLLRNLLDCANGAPNVPPSNMTPETDRCCLADLGFTPHHWLAWDEAGEPDGS